MRLTFLGTGTSFGVPQIGCQCAVCRSTDPRDKRTRSGAVLEANGSTILIDSPPELRLQLLRRRYLPLSMRWFTPTSTPTTSTESMISVFSRRRASRFHSMDPTETLERLRASFNYIFDDSVRPYEGTSKPRLAMHETEPNEAIRVAGIETLPLAFQHGHLRVFGYRFGNLAYITDVKMISELSASASGPRCAGPERVVVAAAPHSHEHRRGRRDRTNARGSPDLSHPSYS